MFGTTARQAGYGIRPWHFSSCGQYGLHNRQYPIVRRRFGRVGVEKIL